MIYLVLIGIGGFLGAVFRYQISRWGSNLKSSFPYATLLVNLLGSFLLGLLVGVEANHNSKLMIGVGFLGAFTTFSTFQFEVVQLWKKDKRKSLIYMFTSYIGGVLLAGLGMILGR